MQKETEAYERGQREALEAVAESLMTTACGFFQAGDDKSAMILRDAAKRAVGLCDLPGAKAERG